MSNNTNIHIPIPVNKYIFIGTKSLLLFCINKNYITTNAIYCISDDSNLTLVVIRQNKFNYRELLLEAKYSP